MAEMPQEDWALLQPDSGTSGGSKIEIHDYDASTTNGKITCRINLIGKLEFRNADGRLLLEEYVRKQGKDVKEHLRCSIEVEAREFKTDYRRGLSASMRFISDPEEKKKSSVWVSVSDTVFEPQGDGSGACAAQFQASVPFMVSSLGYGFYGITWLSGA